MIDEQCNKLIIIKIYFPKREVKRVHLSLYHVSFSFNDVKHERCLLLLVFFYVYTMNQFSGNINYHSLAENGMQAAWPSLLRNKN